MKQTHSPLLLVCSLFLLSGCAFDMLDKGLPRLQGRSIDTAIGYLGIPDAEQTIAGRKVYVWGYQNSGTYLRPVTTYSTANAYGFGGAATAWGTSTSYVPEAYNHNCIIKLMTDKKGYIENGSYEGNMAGCSAYMDAMKRLIADTDASAKRSMEKAKLLNTEYSKSENKK